MDTDCNKLAEKETSATLKRRPNANTLTKNINNDNFHQKLDFDSIELNSAACGANVCQP